MSLRVRPSDLVVPAALILLFATALVGIDRLAFRDVGFFYAPLYDYVAARSGESFVPFHAMWNPLDQTGMPLTGETTTAVYYPVRWAVFSLPLSTDTAMGVYIVLHLAIAAFTATFAARRSGVCMHAAPLAGAAYAMSGSVLSLYTNPPFLVGAAWLPLVLCELLVSQSRYGHRTRLCSKRGRPLSGESGNAWEMVSPPKGQASFRTEVGIASVAMSMMILGGDPQTAFHAVILVIAIGCIRLTMEWRKGVRVDRVIRYFAPTVCCVAVSVLLSLPQIAASLSWSRQSERAIDDTSGGWLDPPALNSKRAQAYHFSVPPWYAAELLTPNAYGSLLPEFRRISVLIPGDGQLWTPSIYMGMLVTLALVSRLLLWQKRSLDVWCVVAVVSWLCAMGHFGLMWFIQNLTGAFAETDSAAGGLYWILYHFVPGYDSLRYPAKWLPLMSLGLAVITAAWAESLGAKACNAAAARDATQSVRRCVALVAFLLGAALTVVTTFRISPSRWPLNIPLAERPVNEFWGPLDVAGAIVQIQWSILHSIIVLALLAVVLMRLSNQRLSLPRACNYLLLILTAELFVFGSGFIAKVNRRDEQQLISNAVQDEAAQSNLQFRMRHGLGWPKHWTNTGSRNRLIEVESSCRLASFGRWHLSDRNPVMNSMVSIRSASIGMFWKATTERLRAMNAEHRQSYWQAVLDWLGVDQVLLTGEQSTIAHQDGAKLHLANQTITRRTTAGISLLRAHSRWENAASSQPSVADFEQVLRSVAENGQPHIPRLFPGKERDAQADDFGSRKVHLNVIENAPEKIVLRVSCAGTCLIERSTLQDGHWKASLWPLENRSLSSHPKSTNETRSLTVHQVDYIKQGVIVPPGHWEVTLYYAPWWSMPSITICLMVWTGLVALVIRHIISAT